MSDRAAAMAARRAAAEAAGLCRNCTAHPARPGRKLCELCVKRAKDRTAANVARGRCSCGRPRSVGYKACDGCRALNIATQAKRRAAADAAGLCSINQLHGPRLPGRSVCEACRDRLRAAARAKYRAAVEAGCCTWSGCSKPATDGRLCAAHRAEERADVRAKYDALVVEGICTISGCDAKAHAGRRLCRRHLRLERKRDQQRRDERKAVIAALAARVRPKPAPPGVR